MPHLETPDEGVNPPVARQIPGEMAPAAPCRARSRNDLSAIAREPADNRQIPTVTSRMDSVGIKPPVTSHQDDPEALKAFRQEVRTKSVDELRVIYADEDRSHRGMLARERDGKAVVHPKVRPFKGYLLAFGPKPDPSYTLDRIDNADREYAPGKCRWATQTTQARNRITTNKLTDRDGRTMTLPEWAEETGTPAATMRKRLERDWLDHEIIAGVRDADHAAAEAERAVIEAAEAAARAKAEADHYVALGWPDRLPQHPRVWEGAFTLFERAFSPFGPATRPAFLYWFLSPFGRALHAHLDSDEPFFVSPDDEQRAASTLATVRRLCSFAWERMGDDERRFSAGPLGFVTAGDPRLRRFLPGILHNVWKMLPHPPLPAGMEAPPPPPPPLPPQDVLDAQAVAAQAAARRAEERDAERARAAVRHVVAEPVDDNGVPLAPLVPRIPDFEDYDTPVPEDVFGPLPPPDPRAELKAMARAAAEEAFAQGYALGAADAGG